MTITLMIPFGKTTNETQIRSNKSEAAVWETLKITRNVWASFVNFTELFPIIYF